MHTANLRTKHGTFTALFSERGLARIEFPGSESIPSGTQNSTETDRTQLRKWRRLTAAALKRILAGEQPIELPPLDFSRGTDFQRRVWSALLRIGPGKTKTYSEVAAAIRRPGAARAVGAACGANPIPILIPCHRVLAAGRRLGGFTAGLAWKRRLLATEEAAASDALA